MTETVRIRAVSSTGDIAIVRSLFEEYARESGADLSFQGFEAELEGLPGKYASPEGCLLLGFAGDVAAGCVAMRRLGDSTCEMKRMYVRPAYRGRGWGRALGERVIADARALGYRAMRLDTLAPMESAIALYRSLGFREIEPYYFNPNPD